MTLEQYEARTYIPSLDSIRAVAIIGVFTSHLDVVRKSDNNMWSWLSGDYGVRLFFVLSGYLITTLCLREEKTRATVSLVGFYIRRAFRLLPAYYITLVFYCMLIYSGIAGVSGRHAEDFSRALPYYLFYFNDFAPPAAFYQSWSLAVEEKFYLVWPVLIFVCCAGTISSRVALTASLIGIFWLLDFRIPSQRFFAYSDILIGCLLAILLQNERCFGILTRISDSIGYVNILIVFFVYQLLLHPFPELTFLYSLAAFFVLLSLTTSTANLYLIESKWMIWIGRRAYSIYLLHVIAIQIVTKILPDGRGPLVALIAALLSLALATLIADLMFRFVERPFIAKGRAMSTKIGCGACG
jgi:peptidoglycan/LPS O-acetylase OafA/YrhL